jgi:hypothetical protein
MVDENNGEIKEGEIKEQKPDEKKDEQKQEVKEGNVEEPKVEKKDGQNAEQPEKNKAAQKSDAELKFSQAFEDVKADLKRIESSPKQVNLSQEDSSKLSIDEDKIKSLLDFKHLEELFYIILMLNDLQIEKFIEHYNSGQFPKAKEPKLDMLIRNSKDANQLVVGLKNELVSSLLDDERNVKSEMSKLRKKGADLFVEGLKILSVPLKIRLFSSTFNKKDYYNVKKIFSDIRESMKIKEAELSDKLAKEKEINDRIAEVKKKITPSVVEEELKKDEVKKVKVDDKKEDSKSGEVENDDKKQEMNSEEVEKSVEKQGVKTAENQEVVNEGKGEGENVVKGGEGKKPEGNNQAGENLGEQKNESQNVEQQKNENKDEIQKSGEGNFADVKLEEKKDVKSEEMKEEKTEEPKVEEKDGQKSEEEQNKKTEEKKPEEVKPEQQK